MESDLICVVTTDIDRAVEEGFNDWYEQHIPGLGDRFVTAVEAAIKRASRWPNSGTPAIHDGDGAVIERKVATAGFPYVIRYRVTEQLLVVMAVYHQHRRPEFGADRVP